ncbi:flagellar biosynthesis protein [Roseobacter sp.]|uniref:FliH/SctL family protein n=1 Tax=Roseobacter sp. TaxID=1907202 RepID=UPI003858B883
MMQGADAVSLEEAKLESFDRGFKAGWDDAIKAQADEKSQISADLASNLQDLSFTFQEARTDMLGALAPLMEDMITKVLPVVAQGALASQVHELIMEEVKDGISEDVSLAVAPDDEDRISDLLSESPSLTVAVRSDPTLCVGQVFLKFADREREINMDETLLKIKAVVDTFFTSQKQEAANG